MYELQRYIRPGQERHWAGGQWKESCQLVNRGKEQEEQKHGTTAKELNEKSWQPWKGFLKLSHLEIEMCKDFIRRNSRGKEDEEDA